MRTALNFDRFMSPIHSIAELLIQNTTIQRRCTHLFKFEERKKIIFLWDKISLRIVAVEFVFRCIFPDEKLTEFMQRLPVNFNIVRRQPRCFSAVKKFDSLKLLLEHMSRLRVYLKS